MRFLAAILCLLSFSACKPPKVSRVTVADPFTVPGAAPGVAKKRIISGEVQGLIGQGLILSLNRGVELPVAAAGAFAFPAVLDDGADYEVSVQRQPLLPSQTCVVQNGVGLASGVDVGGVSVTCTTDHFPVGGQVTGLVGSGLVLGLGTESLPVASSGAFTFKQLVEDLQMYDVTVATHPQLPQQICTVTMGSGRLNGKAIDTVLVECRAVVQPAFVNAPSWNDYVVKGTSAVGTDPNAAACDAVAAKDYDSCLHGGEMRSFVLYGIKSCAGLKATDTLAAFSWVCDDPLSGDATNDVRMLSLRLAPGKRLRDLVDPTTRTIRANAVTVTNAANATVATSASSQWWSNAIQDAVPGSLATPGTIYLITAPGAFTVTANKVSVVVSAATGASPASNGAALLTMSSRTYVWIDGKYVAATGAGAVTDAIVVQASRFVVLRGVSVEKANGGGVKISGSAACAIFDALVVQNGRGVDVDNSSGLVLERVAAASNTNDGVRFVNVTTSYVGELMSSANGGAGMVLSSSSNNSLGDVRTANNTGNGVSLLLADHNRLARVQSTNNAQSQLRTDTADGNVVIGLTATLGSVGVQSSSADGNHLMQAALVSHTTALDCLNGSISLTDHVSDKATSGGYAVSSCTLTLASPAAPTDTAVAALQATFVGPVLVNDAVNPGDTVASPGLTSYAELQNQTANGGWTAFVNPWRAYGLSVAAAFLASVTRGACAPANGCRIYDWSLQPSAMDALRAKFALPAATDTVAHVWTNATVLGQCDAIEGGVFVPSTCTSTFLAHAIEVGRDDIGNDNFLCESNEDCVHAPNIAAYQGHGTGALSSVTGGGAITNVRMISPLNNDGRVP